MTTIHFVYPHGQRISAPQSIGREVALRLREYYEVHQYQWDDVKQLEPSSNAILLGHPHPFPGTIFRQNARKKGWRRVLLLSPFHHADLSQVAYIDHCIHQVDRYLAITGNYWYETLSDSPLAHWAPKIVHVDLAVNQEHFPPLKGHFNPAGKRRFVYIGNSHKGKNLPWLNTIAESLTEYEFGWIGSNDGDFNALKKLGYQDFSTNEARLLVTQYDFLITVGNADANPTTILEAMAWGLIPICTVQSGYRGHPGIINVPLNNTEETICILKELQHRSEEELLQLQRVNYRALQEHFNWERFTQQIIDAIEAGESPSLDRASLAAKAKLRIAEANSYIIHRSMRNKLIQMMVRGVIGRDTRLAKSLKQIVRYKSSR